MSSRRKPRWAIVAVGIAAVSMLVLFVAARTFGRCAMRIATTDYSAYPAPAVFRSVFGRSAHAGIANLEVAGHGLFQGHLVFMRFRADDPAIKSLTSHAVRISRRDAQKRLAPGLLRRPPGKLRGCTDEALRDALTVHWEEVLRARQPEYYEFDASWGGKGWLGVLVVDRDRHLVYVEATAR